LDVVRKAARAADAADEHGLRRIGADLRQRALHGLEDRIVAAARAPADLLVALPVLERGLDGGHVVHSEFLADRSRNLSAPKALSATRQPVKAAQYTFSSLRAYTPIIAARGSSPGATNFKDDLASFSKSGWAASSRFADHQALLIGPAATKASAVGAPKANPAAMNRESA